VQHLFFGLAEKHGLADTLDGQAGVPGGAGAAE